MKRVIPAILILVLSMIWLSGCTPFHQTLTGDEKKYDPTKTEHVAVFLPNQGPTTTYDELGYIVASKGNENEAVQFLQEKAANMGADAVMDCEIRTYRTMIFLGIYEDQYIASGVAVRYRQTKG